MKTLSRSLVLASLVMSLPSCIGAGRTTVQKRPMTSFNIEKKVRVIHGGNLGRNPTGKEILAAWGQPDEKGKSGTDVKWTCHTKPAVKGVVLFAGLPLPAGYPRGYHGIDFYFKENAGTPWRAIERSSGLKGGFVDLGDNGPHYHRLRN